MQPASISARFAAMNLDFLIFMALGQAINMGVEAVAPQLATATVLTVISLLFTILYFVYPTKVSGQTIGKKLLSIKVVPDHNVKARVSWGQAFMREIFGKLLSTLPLCLGFVWAYFKEDKKTWHDSLSKTRVISLVWEEEKSTAQKLQQILLAVISVPAGVGFILAVFLYTSLPLNSIREKIEASGIQVGSLTGSLGGGLRFSEVRRQNSDQNFSLASVEVKFNLWTLVTEKAFSIEKITVEEGHVEVPEDFSLAVVFTNVMAMIQNEAAEKDLRDFTLGKISLKNLSFENKKKAVAHLQELSLKTIAMIDGELYVAETLFQIEGFKLKVTDLKSEPGRIDIGSAIGGVTPEFLPMLKAPVDFHVKGSFGKNPKSIVLDGGLVIDKIKVHYEAEKLTATVEKLVLNEMFKTSVAIDELDMKLSAQGSTVLSMLTTLQVEYATKICGKDFAWEPARGPTHLRGDRYFYFKMQPLPVLDFGQVVFAPEATLDDLFGYTLQGGKRAPPGFANHQEMLSDLCFEKTLAQLLPAELEALKPLEHVAQTGRASTYVAPVTAAAAVAVSPSSSPSASPSQSPSPSLSPSPVASPLGSPSSTPGPTAAPVVVTASPSITPSPTVTVSPSPVVSVSATPVTAPMIMPSVTPSLTPIVSPTVAATATAAPSITPASSPAAAATVPAQTPAANASTASSPTVAASVTPTPVASATPPASIFNPAGRMRAAVIEAKALLKQGKFSDAKSVLEPVPVVTEGFAPAELGAYYNLKGWVFLYSGGTYAGKAAENFELAFSTRKDISDAEGLYRANEIMRKDQESLKWFEYIKTAVKTNPGLKSQLTPNTQKKLPTEASVQSNPQK